MSIIMNLKGKDIIIDEDISIDESMYDNKNNVIRIVLNNTNIDAHVKHLLRSQPSANKIVYDNVGDVIFTKKDTKLLMVSATITETIIPESFKIYEFESPSFTITPVIRLGPPVLVKKLSEYAILPTRNNRTDAGLDIYSVEDAELEPFTLTKIHTGIAIALPENTYGRLADRSSLGAKSMTILGGVIDQGYRGEIIVLLYNLDQRVQYIRKGDRIAQLIIYPITFSGVQEVQELDKTARDNKGFGSSGR